LEKKFMQNYLIFRLELLESYWSQVARIHYALCEFDNITNTKYMEQDIYSEVEDQYITIKTKIKDLLNEEPSAELASTKTCCHDEYWCTDMPKITLSEFDSNQNNW